MYLTHRPWYSPTAEGVVPLSRPVQVVAGWLDQQLANCKRIRADLVARHLGERSYIPGLRPVVEPLPWRFLLPR